MVIPAEQFQTHLRQLLAGAGGGRQFPLPEHGAQFRVPDIDLHHRAAGCQFPHPGADAFGQQEQHQLYIAFRYQVTGRGGAVADGRDIWNMMRLLYRGCLLYTSEKALRYMASLRDFYSAGWFKLLGISDT